MALSSGERLGPYEILSPLGAGGMGEVYRARDARLNRDVALKVLPGAFASDAERMARFQREAQVLASLNHPNIAAIYGLEESGPMRALVMELVEGPTLANRLGRGVLRAPPSPTRLGGQSALAGEQSPPLPIDEALQIARQIAEALEYAHERGVIHRDLKPANIKITPEGTVKVLDFGLAKALDVAASSQTAGTMGNPSAAGPLQDSPTISAMATEAGVILGTAAYMSPEQAKGKKVDRRADIWAFGCVLYEMLTGKQTFGGEAATEVLAAVIIKDPEWGALPATAPAPIQRLLRRCLAKDPKQRLRDVGEARIAIEETLSPPAQAGGVSDVGAGLKPAPTFGTVMGIPPLQLWRRTLPWVAASIFLLAAIFSTIAYWRTAHAPASAVISEILPPTKASFDFDARHAAAPELSPDGHRLVFLASGPEGNPLLWVRSLDSTEAKPLEGTEDAVAPFWSPDGNYIGFFAGGKLKGIAVSGGPPVDICDAAFGRGGSWAPDGAILFAPRTTSPLYRVAAGGGQPVPVTALDQSHQESSHRWPEFLPDNRHFLFYVVTSSAEFSGTYVGSLDGGKPKLLLKGDSNALYAQPGYLLFVRGGTLMAQRFDPGRLELTDDPVPIAPPGSAGSMQIARHATVTVSPNGILVYGAGASAAGWQMQWFDRNGKPTGSIAGAGLFNYPRLSPDGKELAAVIGIIPTMHPDIWVFDLTRGVPTRLTFNPSSNSGPIWSPDGTRIAFASDRKGHFDIYEKEANGTGTEQPLIEDSADEGPDSWSSDGRYIAYDRRDLQGKTGWDIWILPLFGDKKPFPFLESQFNENDASFSPDCKWMAYASDESGKAEVYIAPFPRGNGKWLVSSSGGAQPRWRRDGKELFYLSSDNKLMAVGIHEKFGSLELGNPQALFQTNLPPLVPPFPYDVTADGKKFVVLNQATQSSAEPITLVVNWPALLKKP